MGPSSLLHVIARLKQSVTYQPTLLASQVPLLYREPGVTSGYRPPGKPWGYYVISAFQLNNEIVNIWSHFLAAVVFLLKFFILKNTFDGESNSWQFNAFGICTITYTSLSAFAHMFHSKSPWLHYICFQLDYLGIGIYAMGTNTLVIYTGCPDELFAKLRPYTPFVINIVLAWVYMVGCCVAKLRYRRPYPPQRKLIQLVTGALSVLPATVIIFYRLGTCIADAECSMSSLGHHGRWISPFVLCIFFFSSHLPEKLYPGKFDFVGQGHHLFHVLVAVSSLLQYEAGHIDIIDRDLSGTKPGDYELSVALVMYFVYVCGCGVIIALLQGIVRRRVESDLKMS